MLNRLTTSNLTSQLYEWENFLPINFFLNFLKYVKDLASSENLYSGLYSMALQMTILVKRIHIF